VNTLLLIPDAPAQRRRPRRLPPPSSGLIAGIRPQSRVVVTGIIRSAATITVGSSPAYRLTLADASSELAVLFLGRPSVRGLRPGTRITVEGTAGTYRGRLTLWNPRYAIEGASFTNSLPAGHSC
jgi:RecG-like helicase